MDSNKYTEQIALVLGNARESIKEFIGRHNGEYIKERGKIISFITYFDPKLGRNGCSEVVRIYTKTTLFGIINIYVELGNGVIRHISNCDIWEVCELADRLKEIEVME